MSMWPRIIRSAGVWLCPALAMLAAGLWRIGTPDLWRDELSSWTAATRGLGELFAMLHQVDASIGAYYVVLHFWTELFGASATALRLPSVLAMAGAAAFTALIGRRMFRSSAAGLAAGLLFVAVPGVSRYAQEVRTYAFVVCATAAATWFLLRALERPGFGRWAGYAACTAVGAVFHLVSLSALVGQAALVLLRARRASRGLLWQYPLAALVAVVPAVPVILLGAQQSGRQLSWLQRPNLDLLRMFWNGLLGPASLFYAFVVLASLAFLRRGSRGAAVELLLLAVLPVVAVWLVSQGRTSYFLDRYLLFTVPACAALAGGGVGVLRAALRGAAPVRAADRAPVARGRIPGATAPAAPAAHAAHAAPAAPARSAAASALAALALPTVALALLIPFVLGLPMQKAQRGTLAHSPTDYRAAAALVSAGYRSGDGLVAAAGSQAWRMIGPGIAYHLTPGVQPTPLFVRQSAAQAEDLFPQECSMPASCIGTEPRVWVVTIGTGDDPYLSLPADQARALRTEFTPTEVRYVRGLTVSLLVRSRR
ncbi:glycosyltransferase family 39 protein [Kitasatospora sp. NBC_00374]|uniref:glycosyltransferase family 39 protein n=1 Tax=Kitasatospora sp. NBC_00374 TaxID=2975964 RepID=UPI0030E05E76